MKKFNFEVKDFDSGGRITQITVGSKMMETPNLFPVIHPFRNVIPPKRLYNHLKAQAAFTNAYIIYKNDKYREIVLKKGVHKHLGFPGIIATDSGGFQDYMYSDDIALKPEEI